MDDKNAEVSFCKRVREDNKNSKKIYLQDNKRYR